MRKQGKQKPSTHTIVLCYYGHPFYLHLPEAGLPKYPGLLVGTLKQPLPSLQGAYTRTMAGPVRYKSLRQHCRFKHIHRLESTRLCSVPLSPYQLTPLLGTVSQSASKCALPSWSSNYSQKFRRHRNISHVTVLLQPVLQVRRLMASVPAWCTDHMCSVYQGKTDILDFGK